MASQQCFWYIMDYVSGHIMYWYISHILSCAKFNPELVLTTNIEHCYSKYNNIGINCFYQNCLHFRFSYMDCVKYKPDVSFMNILLLKWNNDWVWAVTNVVLTCSLPPLLLYLLISVECIILSFCKCNEILLN